MHDEMQYHNFGLYNNIDNAVLEFRKRFDDEPVTVKELKYSPNDALAVRLVGQKHTAFLFVPQFGGPGFSLARDKVQHVKETSQS